MNLNLLDSNRLKNDNEEQIIKDLVNEIYQYESKIEIINNNLKKSSNDIYKNIQLKDLNIKKEIFNLKIANLNLSLNNSRSTYYTLIQQKDLLIKELEQKIKDLKEQLNNKEIINFKSLLMIKYILANNSKSNFLSEKQIIDIINDNQKILNNNDNKKYLLNNEINIMNEIIADISLKENKINSNIEEEKELIYMLKEEKNSTNLELINLISYKETIDTVIKINIHLMIKNNSESS